jgi:dolichol phosphate-mannose biosynthesis regulatory protein
MLLTAAFVFTYYTIWALLLVSTVLITSCNDHIQLLTYLQPLLPADSGLHDKFPPREWAVRLPAFILLVGLTGIGGFLGMTMMKEAQKKKAKRAGKSA